MALAQIVQAQAIQAPSVASKVKDRKRFGGEDMARDLSGSKPISNVIGVQIQQVTVNECQFLSIMCELEQVQYRKIDMQPCSADAPTVSPKFAVMIMTQFGTTSVGVVQNKAPGNQAIFFPHGM
jgi:hypothetical protein